MELDLRDLERPRADPREQRVAVVRRRLVAFQRKRRHDPGLAGREPIEREREALRVPRGERARHHDLVRGRERGKRGHTHHPRLDRIPAVHEHASQRCRPARRRLFGLERKTPGRQRHIAAWAIGGARRRRRGAEVERVAPQVRIVRDARQRLPGRHVRPGRAACVFGIRQRAVTHDLGDAIRPDHPHRVRPVLKIERHHRLRRRLNQPPADHEPRAHRDRVARGAGPSQGPAPRPRPVARLEPHPGKGHRVGRGIEQLDELVAGVIADGVVVHLGDDRAADGCAQRDRRQRGCGKQGRMLPGAGRAGNRKTPQASCREAACREAA